MVIVKFALTGIDLLGWPVIALLYPLFASIRAVETGSRNHMRKLAMYWTIFSLFSLFEFAFAKVIDWMPFWSGIRLVLSFCLVMPHFEGSCIAYQGLVCLVVDRFNLLKEERLCKRDSFLDVVEKYIKENGSEALEKFIASEMTSPEARVKNRHPKTPPLKETQQEWTCDLCKIITMGESSLNAHLQGSMHKSKIEFLKARLLDPKDTGPSPSQNMQHRRPTSAAWDLKGQYTAAEVHGRMPPKQPEIPLLKKTQQEWTCDLCNSTALSKSMFNAHLQGSKHKSNLESSKASLIDAKDTAPSPLVQHAQSVSAAWDLKRTYEAAEVKEILPPKDTAENLKKARQEWTCDLCKVTTTSEITLNCHLNGKNHKAKLESTLKESLLDATDTGPSSPLEQDAQSVSSDWDLSATYAATEDKEIMPPQETAEKRLLEIPLLKKAQQEWTGDLCEATTESESALNDHLQGSNHKSKIETTLEAGLLIAKDTGSSPSVQHAQSVSDAWDLKGTYAAAAVEELMPPKEIAENRCPGTPPLKKDQPDWTCDLCEVQHAQSVSAAWDLNGKNAFSEDKEIMTPKDTAEKRLPEIHLLNKSQHEWTGDLCKVTAEGESMLNGDLQGRKQKSKLEATLDASSLDAKDSGPSPSVQHAQSVSSAWDLNRTYPTAEDKEIMPPKEAAETPLKKAQKEWTRDLCRVATVSESMLNDHVQGSQHLSKVETTLNASLLHAQDTGPSPLVQHAQSVSAALDLKGTYVATEVEEIMSPKETAETRLSETHLLNKSQPKWTCDLCKVTTTSELTLNCHLRGSKHKAKHEAALNESFLELEKLIASQAGQGESSVPYSDVQVVESLAKNGSAASQQVQSAQSVSAAWDLNGKNAFSDDKEIMTPKETAEKRLSETHLLKKSQEEWTGDLCKVTAESESMLNGDLQGRKQKSKLEATLDASSLDAKDSGPSPSVQHAQSVSAAWDLNRTYPTAEDKEIMPPKEAAETALKKAQKEWTCDLLKVATVSESMLNDHVQGSQHMSKVETALNASLLQAQDTGPSPLVQHAQSVSAAWDPKGTYVATEFEEIMPPKETAEKRRPKTHLLKKSQPKWTCDLCKVTTTSELTLNCHLRGSKHKANHEAATLNASFLELEKFIASQAGQGESSVPYRDVKAVESLAKNGSAASQQHVQSTEVPKRTDAKAEVKEKKTPPEASRPETRPETRPLKKEWNCGLCEVKTTCEKNLNDHFLGSQHKSKLESLKRRKGYQVVYETIDGKHWCMICNVKLLSDANVASHVKGKRHASNIDVASHIKGKRHASNVDEMKKT